MQNSALKSLSPSTVTESANTASRLSQLPRKITAARAELAKCKEEINDLFGIAESTELLLF